VLPDWKNLTPEDWKLLEENVLGEFGLGEVLKQFLGQERADMTSSAWKGDRYAIFENDKNKKISLVFRLALDNSDDAARFFGQYSELLELKHPDRKELYRRPNFFQFQTDAGGVFLHCAGTTCLIVENATRDTFEKINHATGLPAAPASNPADAKPPQGIAWLLPSEASFNR
jgi:hypothetical protein